MSRLRRSFPARLASAALLIIVFSAILAPRPSVAAASPAPSASRMRAPDAPRSHAETAAAYELLREARDLLDGGSLPAAAEAVAAAERIIPREPAVALFRIWLAAARGEDDDAERRIRAETLRRAGRPDALLELATLLYHRVDFRYSRRVRALHEAALASGDAAAVADAAARIVPFHIDRGDLREAARLLARARRAPGMEPSALDPLAQRLSRETAGEPPTPLRAAGALFVLALVARLFGTLPAAGLLLLFSLSLLPRVGATGQGLAAALLLLAAWRFRLTLLQAFAGYYAAQGIPGAGVALLRYAAAILPRKDALPLQLTAAAHRIAAEEWREAEAELERLPDGIPARDALLAHLHARRRAPVLAHRHALRALRQEDSSLAWQVRIDALIRAGLTGHAVAHLAILSGAGAPFLALELKARFTAGDRDAARAAYARLAPALAALPPEFAAWPLAYGALLETGERRTELVERAFLTHVRHAQIGAVAALLLADAGRIDRAGALVARVVPGSPEAGDFLSRGARAELAPPPGTVQALDPCDDPFGAFSCRRALAAGVDPDAALDAYRIARAGGAQGIARLAAILAALEETREDLPESPSSSGATPFATDLALADLIVRSALAGRGRSCSI